MAWVVIAEGRSCEFEDWVTARNFYVGKVSAAVISSGGTVVISTSKGNISGGDFGGHIQDGDSDRAVVGEHTYELKEV